MEETEDEDITDDSFRSEKRSRRKSMLHLKMAGRTGEPFMITNLFIIISGARIFTSKDIRAFTGAGKSSVQGIITTLSLTYPIYEKGYGKYTLLKDEDL